jgi:osmotically-inducible protein OsmY
MRTDTDIKRNVEAELRWCPQIDETDIASKVGNGVVTLTGFVRNYYEKYQAENAVKRVAGVTGIANDIEVRLPASEALTDPEMAREAVSAIKIALPVVSENLKVLVHQGQVSLEGAVEWYYQKERAENALVSVRGIKSITNLITVKPRVAPTEIKHKIEEAFRRSAEVDAHRVSVEAHDSEVTLRGNVRSWAERDEAQYTAWSAPGVTRVKNEITVSR